MGWVIMSERELNRVEVISQVVEAHLDIAQAAELLCLSRRQVFRLLCRFRKDGPSGLRHRARGRLPNNRIKPAKRQCVLDLIRDIYPDFGPTLVAEMLAAHHHIVISRETLRKWMIEDGLWLSRKQRRTFHQSRLRRECNGEFIQIDGSDHYWFEDQAPPCTLLVFVDDATSSLMQLRFVKSESTFSYFEALSLYLRQHGRPVAFYSDKHSVFRVANQSAKSGHGMTQFGRALNELNIERFFVQTPLRPKVVLNVPIGLWRIDWSKNSASQRYRASKSRKRFCRNLQNAITLNFPKLLDVQIIYTAPATLNRID